MKPIPLSENQIVEVIKNLEQDIQNAWDLFLNFENAEEISINDKLLTGEQKNEFFEDLKKMLGIEHITKDLTLCRKVNLICYKDGFFLLLEAVKSGTLVKFKDGIGTEYELPAYYGKKPTKEKSSKPKSQKPPKSVLGQGALKKLSGGGG